MKNAKRTYLLGEEWLFYKIYCGVTSANNILVNEISKLSTELLKDRLISKWFFIRYKDSENHLRFRVQLIDESKIALVIKKFNCYFSPLINQKIVWNIETSNYNRELERYGRNTIEISEQIFFYQSKWILDLLKVDLDEEKYFLIVLSYINEFIRLFHFNSIETLSFLYDNSKIYEEEFKLDKPSKISIAKKYRELQPKIERLLNVENFEVVISHLVTSTIPILNEIQSKTKQIYHIEKQGKIEVPIKNLLSSYIHMFVNRAFIDKQRFHELIIYDFLYRNLKSTLKRRD